MCEACLHVVNGNVWVWYGVAGGRRSCVDHSPTQRDMQALHGARCQRPPASPTILPAHPDLPPPAPAPAPLACRYRSTWGTLLHIARHEGPSALYRGFLPKAIRLGVGQTIGLMVFQKCLALVGASEGQHERQQMMVMEGVAVAEQ